MTTSATTSSVREETKKKKKNNDDDEKQLITTRCGVMRHSSDSFGINSNSSSNRQSPNDQTSSSILSCFQSSLHHLALTINCVANVPMYSMLFWQCVYWGSCYYAPNAWSRTVLLLYFPYCVLDQRPVRGTSWFTYRQMEWFRHSWCFKGVAQYFPITLHKTVDLPVYVEEEDENESCHKNHDRSVTENANKTNDTRQTVPAPKKRAYLFLYHPHGVISMGANAALMTNACHFDSVFPGIQRHGVTLNVTFWSPLFREWLLALGYIGASKSTLTKKLTQGVSVVLVPGGAVEALHAHESIFRLHIRDRKGFVKLCRETGAAAVPCLGFGENHAFETFCPAATVRPSRSNSNENMPALCAVESEHNDENDRVTPSLPPSSSTSDKSVSFHSLLYAFQQKLYRVFSFSFPILTRMLPNRHPIHVVVGKPVMFDPKQSVDDCHARYLDALRELYDNHKANYGYQNLEMEFV